MLKDRVEIWEEKKERVTIPRSTPGVKKKPPGAEKTGTLFSVLESVVGHDTLEVFGPSGSGKTSFCQVLAAQAAALGKKVVYIDTERNLLSPPRGEGIVYRYIPQLPEILDHLKNVEKADLYIVDSVGFPVVAAYAASSMKLRGEMMLKLIALTGELKRLTLEHSAIAVVTNQPISPMGQNTAPGDLPPFGLKSRYGYKEIWKTEIRHRGRDETSCLFSAWRSRRFATGTELFWTVITSEKIRVAPQGNAMRFTPVELPRE